MVLEILIYLGGETYLSGREGCYRICWRCWKVLFVLKEQIIGNGNRRRMVCFRFRQCTCCLKNCRFANWEYRWNDIENNIFGYPIKKHK